MIEIIRLRSAMFEVEKVGSKKMCNIRKTSVHSFAMSLLTSDSVLMTGP